MASLCPSRYLLESLNFFGESEGKSVNRTELIDGARARRSR